MRKVPQKLSIKIRRQIIGISPYPLIKMGVGIQEKQPNSFRRESAGDTRKKFPESLDITVIGRGSMRMDRDTQQRGT